jgi:adenosylmethionine-8-amino-7-oxononanoate aminotransferase
MEALLTEQADNLAAVILEPVVQGAGGMYFYHPQFLVELRKSCDAHGILLIFDEIATGFGRTGKAFALQHAGVVPDIICLGKALTGGHISFAATVATKDVAYGIGESEAGVFMHGPTFMGNPLACAAACASLDLMADGTWQNRVAQIEAQMREELEPARAYDGVVDVRVLGAIGVIQMAEWQDTSIAHGKARESGVYLRPFAHNIYTMPPFITEPEDLSRITAAMLDLAKGA